MKKVWLTLAAVVVYILHQDFWWWNQSKPMVFGFLPIALAYHAIYAVVCALLMGFFVRWAWPEELDAADIESTDPGKKLGNR